MYDTLPAQSGPDQLDNLAQTAEANGLYVNAENYRQLGRDWRQLEADLECANKRIAEQSTTIDRLHRSINQAAVELRAVA